VAENVDALIDVAELAPGTVRLAVLLLVLIVSETVVELIESPLMIEGSTAGAWPVTANVPSGLM
jgi:hypothetical protein